MSTASEQARAANKAKAERMVRGDPRTPVDASGYSPQGALDGNVQTGERVLSRRAFKRGGKVAGEAAEARADRKPRKSGGSALSANSFINRDVKEANEERVGTKHVGGFKRGGRAHKTMGGLALPNAFTPVARAAGGHVKGCECAKCGGGRVGKDAGGALRSEYDANKAMAKVAPSRAAQGVAQSAMKMAGKQGVDPYNSHGTQAKAYDSLFKLRGGRPARAEGGAINDGTRPAGGRIARKAGGRTKKGTNVNVIIMPSGGGAPPPMAAAPPAAPPGGPLGLRQGVPPPAPPMAPPAGAPPPMGRAAGGRTLEKDGGKLVKPGSYPIDAGSGGGLGRLEKAQRAARG